MKLPIFIYLTVFLIIIIAGCEHDNFEEPASEITGQVVYEGEAIGVKSNEIELELWQSGFELDNDVPVFVDQDGSYAATLFDGEYQLVLREGNGPWMNNTDSIDVQLDGRAEVDIPVEPFYIINDESINHDNGTLEATFTVQEINDSQDLEFVGLYIGTNAIVDEQYNEMNLIQEDDEVDIGAEESISLSLSDELSNREYVFARVGLKIEGRSELLFTSVQKIEF